MTLGEASRSAAASGPRASPIPIEASLMYLNPDPEQHHASRTSIGLDMRIPGWGIKYDLLGAIETKTLRGEVRKVPPVPPQEFAARSPADILCLNMLPDGATHVPRELHSGNGFTQLGPLAFWPRSTRTQIRSSGSPAINVIAIFNDDVSVPDEEPKPRSIFDPALIELMRLLHDEIREPGFANQAMIESIGDILRTRLARIERSRRNVLPLSDHPMALAQSDVARIRDYLEAHRGSPPNVSELADLCNVSRRSLLRRFQAASGMSVANYVREVQVAKAKSLLIAGNMSLKQVAYEVGMAPNNFSNAFKRATGMTPAVYRTAARQARYTVQSR